MFKFRNKKINIFNYIHILLSGGMLCKGPYVENMFSKSLSHCIVGFLPGTDNWCHTGRNSSTGAEGG